MLAGEIEGGGALVPRLCPIGRPRDQFIEHGHGQGGHTLADQGAHALHQRVEVRVPRAVPQPPDLGDGRIGLPRVRGGFETTEQLVQPLRFRGHIRLRLGTCLIGRFDRGDDGHNEQHHRGERESYRGVAHGCLTQKVHVTSYSRRRSVQGVQMSVPGQAGRQASRP